MSIFSRVKKAKKAADNHGRTAVQAQAVEETNQPSARYKHVPTHAAQDALAANPVKWSPEETKARIAAARKRRSEMNVSVSAATSPSRTNREFNFPIHAIYRIKSDLSIDSVMKGPQTLPNELTDTIRPLAPPSPNRQIQLSEEYHVFSMPRDAPILSSWKPRVQHSRRNSVSSSPTTKRRSPLFNASPEEGMWYHPFPESRFVTNIWEEPENVFSHTPKISTSSATSSTNLFL